MDIFLTLRSRSLSVTAMLNFSGKANTSIHGLGENYTARSWPDQESRSVALGAGRTRLAYKAAREGMLTDLSQESNAASALAQRRRRSANAEPSLQDRFAFPDVIQFKQDADCGAGSGIFLFFFQPLRFLGPCRQELIGISIRLPPVYSTACLGQWRSKFDANWCWHKKNWIKSPRCSNIKRWEGGGKSEVNNLDGPGEKVVEIWSRVRILCTIRPCSCYKDDDS